MLVRAVHPVAYLYRPRRARTDLFDFGAGHTTVELREVGERPREALRIGQSRVFAAEGMAWTLLREGRESLRPADLAAFLESPGRNASNIVGTMGAWAARSPLFFRQQSRQGRVGDVDPAGAEILAGAEQASADVAAFLDDRVRLWGDRVLVREERLVGLSDFYQSRPRIGWGDHPRGPHLMTYRPALVAIRPDRLGAAWDLHERKRKGDVPRGEWDALAEVPAELRRDDDVAWLANCLPEHVLTWTRSMRRAGADPGDPASRLGTLLPGLEELARRGTTFAIRGDAVGQAVEHLRAVLGACLDLRRGEIAGRPGIEEDGQVRTYGFLLRLIDREIRPRLASSSGLDEDAEALASIAPSP